MDDIKIGPLKKDDVRQNSKCPTSYHSSTDRQSTLILLFMALSSLDINKMASKNLFYINRACLQDMARRLRKFLKFYFGQNKRIWYSEIPSLWFRNLIFRTCLGYIRIKVGIFWNLFSFEPNQNFSKWIPQMPFCCVSRNSFSWPLLNPFCLFNFFSNTSLWCL